MTKSREDLMKELKDHINELQAEENNVGNSWKKMTRNGEVRDRHISMS